jgi:hypothetical protein
MKPFYICLTFDTDPDPSNGFIDRKEKNIIGWKGLNLGKELIFKKICEYEKKFLISMPTTWFVRVDDQIKHDHGNETWIIRKFLRFWKKILKNKGSIQWHIHLNTKKNNGWFKESSANEISKTLTKNFKSFKDILKKPRCIRIGEAYLDNNIANTLRMLDIEADSSALPGRKRKDEYKSFDWSRSLNQPYFISKKDYQKSTKKNSKNDLLEIPMNTLKTKCSYDKKPLKRYFNLSFKNKILSKHMSKFIKENDYLVTMTHPFEVVSSFKNKKNSRLVSFSMNEFEKNILSLILLCKKNNKDPIFLNIENMIDTIKNV